MADGVSVFDYRMLFDDNAGQRHSDQDTIKQKCNKFCRNITNSYLYLMQADLLSLEDHLGSGRLPTHIFLLDSLSVPRNQVLK